MVSRPLPSSSQCEFFDLSGSGSDSENMSQSEAQGLSIIIAGIFAEAAILVLSPLEALSQQRVLMKFKGMRVPLGKDVPFAQQASTCKMKQNFSFIRNLSTGQQMRTIFGKSWSENVEARGLPVSAPLL